VPGTRAPRQWACGCIQGHRRCPEHAAKYAIKKMTEKGWGPVPAEYEEDLKKLGVRLMEWTIGFDEATKKMQKGNWAKNMALLFGANPAPWEVRKWFLQYIVAGRNGPNTDQLIEFVNTLKAADRLGGAQAVADVMMDHWENLGIEYLKALGGQ